MSVDGTGRLRHTGLGYEIGPPPSGTPGWTRVAVQGATLSYQRRADELMSMRVSCERPQAAPRILARHLRIGVGRYVLRAEGPLEYAGLAGWQQTFDVSGGRGDTVRVQSITLVDGRCTVDFILSDSRGFDGLVEPFENWWRSYQPIDGKDP